MKTNPIHAFNLPSPYQTDLDELARREQLVKALRDQSLQPPETFSYKGIPARVSPFSYLAKALQGYTSAKDQREILAERKALGERYRKEGMDDMTRYAEMAGKPAVAAVPGQDAFMPMPADYDDRAMGGAPDFKLDAQGMVPAVDPVAARMRGQIDPAMIGQFKTPEMQQRALAQMIKQGELPAAFNLGAEETRFQPPVGGGAPVVVARGAAKPLPSPFAGINPKDFTQESLKAAIKPDGTLDRTLLIPVAERATGNLAELAAENADRKSKGLPPLSIAQYREQIAKASRTPPAQRERSVYDANRGGVVNLDTGVFTPAMQGGKPIGPAQSLTVAKEVMGIQQGRSTMQGAINAVEASPSAFGLKRGAATASGSGVAESIAGRFDTPQETEARAYVFNNVSAVIKERAGTAQSAQELTRINSFLPGATDNANQIINKLKGYLKYLDDLEAGTVGKPTQPTTPTVQTPIYANAPGKPKLMSTDGGKTWKEAK